MCSTSSHNPPHPATRHRLFCTFKDGHTFCASNPGCIVSRYYFFRVFAKAWYKSFTTVRLWVSAHSTEWQSTYLVMRMASLHSSLALLHIDCNLSVAFAVELCLGRNPQHASFDQKMMCEHLYTCFTNGVITSFPKTSSNELLPYAFSSAPSSEGLLHLSYARGV